MVKLLIFDMDGTLIDTDEVLIKTWSELFRLYKDKDYKIDTELIRTFSGPPIEQSMHRAFPELDYNFILKEYRERTKKYYDTYLNIFDNEQEVLKKLYEDGYLMAIATTKNKEMALKCLEKYKIKDYFKIILTSSDPVKPKPDPEALNLIMNRLSISPSKTIMIGDTDFDFYAARNAKINAILLSICKRTHHEDVKPLAFVNSYKELYEFIKNLNNFLFF